MNNKLYLDAVDAIEEVGGAAVISDLEIEINGTIVDVIKYENTWDNGKRFSFYAGNPLLDGTDDEEDWEELQLDEKEEEKVLEDFVAYF